MGVIHIATTDIDELSQFIEAVYPNPVTNVLSIRFKDNNFENISYQLVNLYGSIVMSGKISNELDVSALKNGVYHLRIFAKENQSTIKIIKH